MKTAYTNIDQYIAGYPKETQVLLQKIRTCIQKAAPNATETINYGIPTFQLEGNLVHFAAYKHHIGFYPAPAGLQQFKKELAPYLAGKGTAQFQLDQPIPFSLIEKIVKFRVQQNLEKAKEKTKRICKNGHTFYKTSDCPVCPICEKAKKPNEGFLSVISAPARRALEKEKIKTLQQLSKYSEKDLLQLHGIGKTAIPKLQAALKEKGLKLKK